ncbi:FAD-dependent oxidoreductase [bacterium BMS3Abin03]|nr:FAD-dependent oxidoreductase [bacterium BMS3Abin03]MCG6959091.1 FAD-dependent oxidoreductase [bacterium BMS3Abin03]
MAKVVKKVKKPLGGLRGHSAGGSSVETSPLRPVQVPKTPPCSNGCPNETNIREFLTTISQSEGAGRSYKESYEKAWGILTEKNPFPSSCGRVCPHPCESECNRTYKDGAVGINNLERFVGDYAIEQGFQLKKISDENYEEKIAVIGAGPAGLSCAYQLARRGYGVTIFEAFSKPGGMLRYGIPDYRLPPDVLDKEIKRIEDLGVEIKCNQIIGKDIPYENLQKDYSAIFVGIGAHKGKLLGIPNEDASNVFTGTEFLNKINSGETVEVGDKVLVVGGGDTAIDAARVSKRLGADVTIVYRRTRKEMPAIEEEIVGAEEEGVKLEFLAAPVEFEKAGDKITKMECQKMELGEPDSSGRRRPVPIPDSFFTLDATTVIAAISQEPDFNGLDNLHEGKDWIKVDENSVTKIPDTYAGGDALELGLATIAIFQGRKAAEAIHNRFRDIQPEPEQKPPVITHDKIILNFYESKLRNEPFKLSPEERLGSIDGEITSTLTEEQAIEEAKRCMSCASCFDCGTCWSYCQDQAIVKPVVKHQPYKFKLDLCNGCNKCAENCPCGYIEMR